MNEQKGHLMYGDINTQSDSLQAVLRVFFKQSTDFERIEITNWFTSEVVFTGCGTTYALSSSAAIIFNQSGFSSIALPASEISFYPEIIPNNVSALIAFSRSGETSETLWAAEKFRQQRPDAKMIVITANPNSSLAQMSDLILDASDAKDLSVIETKSFTGMLLLAQVFCAWLVGDQLTIDHLFAIPMQMKRLMPKLKELAQGIAYDLSVSRFFFLGSGPLYGASSQSAFTMKECTAEWSEAFHPLEFRHGPRTSATEGAFVGLYCSDSDRVTFEEQRVLMEMKSQGAKVLAFEDKLLEPERLIDDAVDVINLQSGLASSERVVLLMPFVQWLAYFRSLAKGQDPDQPANLLPFTRL